MVLSLVPAAFAAEPVLTDIIPRGAQRGTEVTLTFKGARLLDAQEVLFYTPGFAVVELKPEENKVTVKLTIAADCAVGEHIMRVRCASGVSAADTFWVSHLPVIDEVEPNSEFTAPQKVPLNTAVHGVVTPEDVDYFQVEAKKGQRISAEIVGVRLGTYIFDPYLAILDGKRFELAASDDTSLLLQESIVTAIAPEDGVYTIQLREASYGGDPRDVYQLHIGTFPRPLVVYPPGGKAGQAMQVKFIGDAGGEMTQDVTLPASPPEGSRKFYLMAQHDGQSPPSGNPFRVSAFDNVLEVEPNNQGAAATAAAEAQTLPLAFNGVVGEKADEDWFKFAAKKGQAYHVKCYARSLGSPLDAVLSLHNHEFKQLAANDDAGGPDAALDWTAPEDGVYCLRIADHLRNGGPQYVYRVEITPDQPSLTVMVPRYDQYGQARQVIPVPKGSRYAAVVNVSRSKFGGELVIEAPDLPAGVTLHAPPVPDGQNQVAVVFEASADAAIAGKLVALGARHADESKGIRGGYWQDIYRALQAGQAIFYTTYVDRIPVAVVDESPFTIEVIEPKVPIVQNGSMNLKVVATRKEGFDAPISVRLLWTPPGIGATAKIDIPKGQTEAMYPITARGNAPAQTWQVVFLGESSAGKGELLAASKLTKVTVAPPYLEGKIELAAIEQGGKGEMVCKIENLKPFAGSAQVKLLGLPNKVTTEEKQITKDDKEVVFPITSEKDAPVGKHQKLFCQVVITEQGEPVTHSVGDGVLRIDKPAPPKKEEPKPATVAAPVPAPADTAKPSEPPKRLSRLEQLRLDAQKSKEGAK